MPPKYMLAKEDTIPSRTTEVFLVCGKFSHDHDGLRMFTILFLLINSFL